MAGEPGRYAATAGFTNGENRALTPQWRTSPLALYGLLGIATAAIIHFETYFGLSIDLKDPLFFLVHISIFPLFFAFVLRARRWSGRVSFFNRSEPSHLRELLRFFPLWVYPAALVLFVYTAVNFLLSVQHLPNHSSNLTGTEARYMVRAFSGHWLFFFSIPTVFFGFVPKDARPQGSAIAHT
jgi:hypothetical protein